MYLLLGNVSVGTTGATIYEIYKNINSVAIAKESIDESFSNSLELPQINIETKNIFLDLKNIDNDNTDKENIDIKEIDKLNNLSSVTTTETLNITSTYNFNTTEQKTNEIEQKISEIAKNQNNISKLIRDPRYVVTDITDTWKDISIQFLYVIDTQSSDFSIGASWIEILKKQTDSKKIEWWVEFTKHTKRKQTFSTDMKDKAFRLMRIKDNGKYQWDENSKTFPTQEQLKTDFEDIYFHQYVTGMKTASGNNKNIFKDRYIFLGIEEWSAGKLPNPLKIKEIRVYLQDEDQSRTRVTVFDMKYKKDDVLKTCSDAFIKACESTKIT